MGRARDKKIPIGTSEVCWWDQTRIVLEEVFRVPRLTGTFPFDTGYDVRLWPSIVLVVVTIILGSLSILLIPYVDPEYFRGYKVFFIFAVRVTKGTTSTIYNILCPLCMVYNHKCLKKLLRHISSVEKELDKASLKWIWNRSHRRFFFFLAVGSLVAFIQFILLYVKRGFLTAFSLATVVLTPFPSISYVWQYLSLHDILRSLMTSIGKLEDVDSFVNCYHSLVLAYRAVDKLYGFQILLYFIMAMVTALRGLHLYFFTSEFSSSVVGPLLWASFYSALVLLIIRRCNASVAQSKMVNEQLYKRMVYEDNNNLINDKLLAFHLSSSRKLVFTACGFFNLDNSLICSMIACATTYLVIMLQFTLPTSVNTNTNRSFAQF